MQKILFIGIIIFILGGGAFFLFSKRPFEREGISPRKEQFMANKERVSFDTVDGVTIEANFFVGSGQSSAAILLLHMMPATKESWDEFAKRLVGADFQVLAIDLRGHGESTKIQNSKFKIQNLDYEHFSDSEHLASRLDVEAAREWLMNRGVPPEEIFVGGASIGANLALQYLAEHPEAPAGFLLSPGLDYRGIKTDALMERLVSNQRVFLVAAEDDEYSAQTVRALNEMGQAQKALKVYEAGGHGTDLFDLHPELMGEITKFLISNF